MNRFAALCFTEDENLCDRVYWYLCGEEVTEGMSVLAPVGPHDKLQCAFVEKVLSAPDEEAPYDVRLCKRVASPPACKRKLVGETAVWDLGGIRYDDRHYTRFHAVYYAQDLAEMEGVCALCDPSLEEAARIKGPILIYGTHTRETVKEIVRELRRGETEVSRLLREKLC